MLLRIEIFNKCFELIRDDVCKRYSVYVKRAADNFRMLKVIYFRTIV